MRRQGIRSGATGNDTIEARAAPDGHLGRPLTKPSAPVIPLKLAG
jgi:hypothetical protein